uniref:Uncharacterized protein n=1 Tax=Orbilia brochopaga TaxID=3140254 RepID=A0A4Y5MXQ3_9PEZI|nr:hypothetical protein [Drechslerella brochopaga]
MGIEWYNINYALSLSKGGTKLLQGFGQYISRILEQSMYTNYKPSLNINNEQLKDIIFFNFAFEANELSLSLDETHVYQTWDDKETTILLTESDSYNSLAKQLDISVNTIRNNMNWYKGVSVDYNNQKFVIYLKEKGVSFRSDQLNSQLKPKDKYSLIELNNKSLYDLVPGKIYVIDVNTLEIIGDYKNKRGLWNNLNPNYSELDNLSAVQ